MKLCYAQTARPGALGRRCKRWRQTIHVVSTITVVTEQQLIIVVRSATNGTAFAFDTLPPVLANRNDHVRCELQTSRMPWATAITARDQLLGTAGLFIFPSIAQTEVAVRGRLRGLSSFFFIRPWRRWALRSHGRRRGDCRPWRRHSR